LIGRLLNLLRRHEPLGRRGEQLAATWLQRRGYSILERNRTVGKDEADLVALDPDHRTVVVIEVKTRQADSPPPEAQLNRRKRLHMVRLAASLQRSRRYRDRPFRLDAIAIVWPEGGEPQVRHYVGAFESPF
jgi:putative endonuclease